MLSERWTSAALGREPSPAERNGRRPDPNAQVEFGTAMRTLMKNLSKPLLCVAAMSLLLVSEAWAQISGGSIAGSVLDSSGGVIIGAKVTATNVATNEVSRTVTN